MELLTKLHIFLELIRLEKLGALEWTKVVHKHQGWRLVTCIWLHAGIIHLVANMLSLVFIGIRLEQQFGFGMTRLGVFLSLLTLLIIVVINLAIGILPHVDNFAHIGGFLTGFLIGFILMPRHRFGLLENPNLPAGVSIVKSKYKGYQYVLWILSLVLLIVGFTFALLMLHRGENGNDRCHWCHYLSCVPTSRWHCEEN